MQYDVMLDTYTIDRQEFVQEYEKSDDKKKVMMNIDKFIKMLNSHDYSNLYAILDEDFKTNYFRNEDDFVNYVKENFFDINKVEYSNFSEMGNTYIYEITITNVKDESEEQKKKTIIMKLLEGTDFVMSFNVE